MNVGGVVRRVQVAIAGLGEIPAEYRITEIHAESGDLHFNHVTKTVRVGKPARAVPNFLGPAAKPKVPNFL